MSIDLLGTLEGPLGNSLANTNIRVHLVYSSEGKSYLYSELVTDSEGNYSFSLEEGKYKIEIKQKNKYNYGAYVDINEDTPSDITLEELVQSHSFCLNEEKEFHFVQDDMPDISKAGQGAKWYKGDTGQEFILYGDTTEDLVWVETYFIIGDALDE